MSQKISNQRVYIKDPHSGEVVLSETRTVHNVEGDGYGEEGQVTIKGTTFDVARSRTDRAWSGDYYKVKQQ